MFVSLGTRSTNINLKLPCLPDVFELFLLSYAEMAMEQSHHEKQQPAATNPATTSCRKKKSEEATFLEDVKDHIDEFIHASMDEHKTCFKKTIQKVSPTP